MNTELSPIFGKLTLEAIPYHEPILVAVMVFMVLGGLAVLGGLTYYRKWTWLWNDWLTSVDHKKIGIMYIFVAFIMLLRGFSDAIMMRAQQAVAVGDAQGYLPPHHYDQIFTAHGTIMIFFMAMPFIIGLINIVTPLQIGARDVAFPLLNSISFWLFVVGVILVNLSLVVGEFGQTGWLAYPPLSGKEFSPGVGVDYWIWAVQISGIGTTLTGVNFFVTILKMRAPGMKLMQMPVFTWTVLVTMVLIIISFPVLTVTLVLLTLDRYMDMHFFTNALGGNQMLYVSLIWIWGHPEVYILVLPAFGIFSEITSTFSRKPLFGYKSMVWATIAIGFLSFIVWLHHFFTMGAGANVNAFFGIMSMVIAIPTGVKIFNWLFTMFRGRVHFTTPMLWTIGFILTFVIGGMTGVMLAIPAADFVLHNSLFLIAHFHNVIIGGVVFGVFAGFTYWFPKAMGFRLNERLGKYAFWCWFVGFWVAFMPLYILGFMGATRRLQHYHDLAWQPYFIVAAIGAAIVLAGICFQILQIAVSIRDREELKDASGDPWNGRTLEWSISSPPPHYNFAVTPDVQHLDDFWEQKEEGRAYAKPAKYEPIHMPKNSSVGVLIGAFATIGSFALIWYIWWLAIACFAATIVTVIVRSFVTDVDYYVQVDEIEATQGAWEKQLAEAKAGD